MGNPGKDTSRMVGNCLDAINSAVNLHKQAGTIILDTQQIHDLDKVHVPSIVGNWLSHYETGTASSLSAPVLGGVIISIDALVSVRGLYESDESVIRRPLLKS